MAFCSMARDQSSDEKRFLKTTVCRKSLDCGLLHSPKCALQQEYQMREQPKLSYQTHQTREETKICFLRNPLIARSYGQ